MDFKKALTKKQHKEDAVALANTIGSNQTLFDELWQLVAHGEPPIPQRGAWIVELCTESNPNLLSPHMDSVVELLNTPNHHNAIYRHLLKILANNITIPKQHYGTLFNFCAHTILDPNHKVAAKVHAMRVAAQIAQDYDELKEELKTIIEDQMEYGSAGFKSCGKKVLKQLRK